MIDARHTLVRRIGALLMAVLWLQVFLGANLACSTPSADTPAAAHHANHENAPPPTHHSAQHCLMTLSCSVAVVSSSVVVSVALPHDVVVGVNSTAPASVAGAIEPPPPRA